MRVPGIVSMDEYHEVYITPLVGGMLQAASRQEDDVTTEHSTHEALVGST